MTAEGKTQWLVTGRSIRGASHNKSGQPNQDAIVWFPKREAPAEPFTASPIILAVSDGHGSSKSFRSQIGSQLAVDVALQTLQQLLNMTPSPYNLSHVKEIAEERLPKMIASLWRDAVNRDIQTNNDAFQRGMNALAEREPGAGASVKGNELIAYGATLLAIMVTESYILFLQLGDGDILFVDAHERLHRPFERDERLIANETLSLCLPSAWRDFQVRLLPTADSAPPLLVLATTDGYINSYANEDDFTRVAFDYLDDMRRTTLSVFPQRLDRILEDISQRGSGDDMTLGLIKRVERDDQEVRSQASRAQRQELIALRQGLVELSDTLRTRLAGEAAARAQLQDALQTGLAGEAAARAQLQDTLQTGLAGEAAARAQLHGDVDRVTGQLALELQTTRRELSDFSTGAERFDQRLQVLSSKVETDELARLRAQLQWQRSLISLALGIAAVALVAALLAAFVF